MQNVLPGTSMKKIEDLKFPSSSIKAIIRDIKKDVYVQKGVVDLVAKCAVVSTSFIAHISNAMKEKNKDSCLTYSHISGVFEGLGLFKLAESFRERQKQHVMHAEEQEED